MTKKRVKEHVPQQDPSDPGRHSEPGIPFNIWDRRFVGLRSSQITTVSCGTAPYVTVIFVPPNQIVDAVWLGATIKNLFDFDDVYLHEFLGGVLFTHQNTEAVDIRPKAEELLHTLGTTWIGTHEITSYAALPRPGPYLVTQGKIFEIWRLYDDVQGAFLHSLVPGPKSEPQELQLDGETIASAGIAVPARVRRLRSDEEPLSGLRIAVKDIFEIKGVRTTVCNKAYYELNREAPKKTAACIDLLIKAGAHIVGTTKLASFAATEEPVECVDYQAPWNPRGDGYQSPAGSSSGSGAAIASYDWLDIAIGSDTSGSGRRPGHWNGCFAMRPTHGVLPVEGYIPSFRQFDVPTFFGRDIRKCKEFAKIWYGSRLVSKTASAPTAIIYPTDYMSLISNKTQLDVIDQFVADLENSLGVKQEHVSFRELWDSLPPAEAKGMSLDDFMKDACRNSFFHDDYHSFDKFRADYEEEFHKTPYVSPPVRWQWELSSKITTDERDLAVHRLAVYGRWFSDHVLKVNEVETVIIIPIENISPRYRDDSPLPHFNPVSVPMLFISPILGAPEVTVPIGRSPYESKVTGWTENLPIGVSVLGAPGRDLELFDIIHDCLVKSGRPTSVFTGKELFERA